MEKIISIQYLRGIAASLVLSYHAAENVDLPIRTSQVFLIGEPGVDIFFVLSGFLTYVVAANKNVTTNYFLWNRISRIAPIYWIFTILYVFMMYSLKLFPETIAFTDLALSLLFIPYTNTHGVPMPILGVGWTLTYQVMFYAVFSVFLLARPGPWRLIGPIIALSALCAVRPLVDQGNGFAFRVTSPLLLEFCAGMVIGAAVLSGRLPTSRAGRNACGLALVAAALGLIASLVVLDARLPRTIAWGVPATLLVLAAALLEPTLRARPFAPLVRLGDASFSIVLAHTIAFVLLGRAISPGVIAAWPWTMLATQVVAGLGLGLLSYRFVERPLVNLLAVGGKSAERRTGWDGQRIAPRAA